MNPTAPRFFRLLYRPVRYIGKNGTIDRNAVCEVARRFLHLLSHME